MPGTPLEFLEVAGLELAQAKLWLAGNGRCTEADVEAMHARLGGHPAHLDAVAADGGPAAVDAFLDRHAASFAGKIDAWSVRRGDGRKAVACVVFSDACVSGVGGTTAWRRAGSRTRRTRRQPRRRRRSCAATLWTSWTASRASTLRSTTQTPWAPSFWKTRSCGSFWTRSCSTSSGIPPTSGRSASLTSMPSAAGSRPSSVRYRHTRHGWTSNTHTYAHARTNTHGHNNSVAQGLGMAAVSALPRHTRRRLAQAPALRRPLPRQLGHPTQAGPRMSQDKGLRVYRNRHCMFNCTAERTRGPKERPIEDPLRTALRAGPDQTSTEQSGATC